MANENKPKELDNRLRALIMWKNGHLASDIAKEIGVVHTTVLRWIKKWEKGDYTICGVWNETLHEVALQCDEKKQEVVEDFVGDFMTATKTNIKNLNELLGKRVKDALECENEFQSLIHTVWSDPDLKQDEKQRIVAKINQMTLADTSKLTTMIGTLIDKHQLLDGKATERVEGNIKLKFEDIPE